MSKDQDPDFAFEPIPGLPEQLPAGEHILWQGRPATWALAREALNLSWVAGYFVLLAFWRVAASSVDQSWAGALPLAIPFLLLGAVACGIILLIAWVQARATLYTITNQRVAMRIGAALTLTVNLPFPRIAGADLSMGANGAGTIAMRTLSETRLSFLVLWPHVRPWQIKRTQPALRCIRDPETVAGILADAAETRVAQPVIARRPAAVAAE